MALPLDAEMDSTSIVMLGSFNPAIFHPMWFGAQELLSREDAEAAKITVVHQELAHFEARQFRVSVEPGRFAATCETIHRNIVRDLVLACFGRILVHTPVRMMGLNRELHFNCGNEAKRSTFGFALAPLEPWGKWGKEIADDVGENKLHGGMMRLQMRQVPRPDGRPGYIQTEIQPSSLIRAASGVFIQVNNHLEFATDAEHPAQSAMEALDATWNDATAKAEAIIGEVMMRATKEEA